jgi:hypothetical protein
MGTFSHNNVKASLRSTAILYARRRRRSAAWVSPTSYTMSARQQQQSDQLSNIRAHGCSSEIKYICLRFWSGIPLEVERTAYENGLNVVRNGIRDTVRVGRYQRRTEKL